MVANKVTEKKAKVHFEDEKDSESDSEIEFNFDYDEDSEEDNDSDNPETDDSDNKAPEMTQTSKRKKGQKSNWEKSTRSGDDGANDASNEDDDDDDEDTTKQPRKKKKKMPKLEKSLDSDDESEEEDDDDDESEEEDDDDDESEEEDDDDDDESEEDDHDDDTTEQLRKKKKKKKEKLEKSIDVEDNGDSDEKKDDEDDEEETKAQSGFANVLSNILGKKTVSSKKVILAQGKTDREIKKLKESKLPPEEKESKEKILTAPELEERRIKRKVWLEMCKVKPNVLERNRERELKMIATRGVVQLFNAVRKQQKLVNEHLSKSSSERKKEMVIESMNKKSFINLLQNTKVDVSMGTEEKEKPEAKEPERKIWSVLTDDFVIGTGKMKDWDKQQDMDVS